MSEHEVDVVVIGLGPGGEYAGGRLAEAGLAVAGVESRLVGGECPYWGCVPSKMMIRAANLLAEARRIPGMAGASMVHPDWAPVAARIREAAQSPKTMPARPSCSFRNRTAAHRSHTDLDDLRGRSQAIGTPATRK